MVKVIQRVSVGTELDANSDKCFSNWIQNGRQTPNVRIQDRVLFWRGARNARIINRARPFGYHLLLCYHYTSVFGRRFIFSCTDTTWRFICAGHLVYQTNIRTVWTIYLLIESNIVKVLSIWLELSRQVFRWFDCVVFCFVRCPIGTLCLYQGLYLGEVDVHSFVLSLYFRTRLPFAAAQIEEEKLLQFKNNKYVKLKAVAPLLSSTELRRLGKSGWCYSAWQIAPGCMAG